MNDDRYLWDGSGEPDPEVEHMESLLSQFRHGEPLRSAVLENVPGRPARPQRFRLSWLFGALATAAAAAILIVVTAGPWLVRHAGEAGPAWKVKALSGEPRIDGNVLGAQGRLGLGGLLETDAASRAELTIGMIGRVDVEPNTRLRLVETRPERYRMALERGDISAHTWAPPFTFVVDTPSVSAYDVGCAFTLHADPNGAGLLRVTSGWVQIEYDYRQVLIPAGAVAAFRAGVGPGTPYFEDASTVFKATLERLDFESEGTAGRSATLAALLASARGHDAYSLIAMMKYATPDERELLLDRAAELLPLPARVTRAGVLSGDERMHDEWMKELHLGGVKRWWVHWKDILP
jgi:hypothetical protein